MQLFPLKINNNERGPFGQGICTGGIEMIMLAHSELSLNIAIRDFF